MSFCTRCAQPKETTKGWYCRACKRETYSIDRVKQRKAKAEKRAEAMLLARSLETAQAVADVHCPCGLRLQRKGAACACGAPGSGRTGRRAAPGRLCLDCGATAAPRSVFCGEHKKTPTERARLWAAANPERQKKNKKASHLRNYAHKKKANYDVTCLRRYGVTASDVFAYTNGRCAICVRPVAVDSGPFTNKTNKGNIDHDHATLKVRGGLCGNCNRALGLLRDSPFLLGSAIRYLLDPTEDRKARGVPFDPTAGGLLDGSEGVNYVPKVRQERKRKP